MKRCRTDGRITKCIAICVGDNFGIAEDICQACATCESTTADTLYTTGNNDISQAAATREGVDTDA